MAVEKKRSTLHFLQRHEEVPFQVETPRVMEPVSCKFGSCSLFDAKAAQADALPVDFPSAVFLEETLAGMFGSPGASAASKSWLRLQAVMKDSAAQCCTCLTWVALGQLFHTVACLPELKQRMASHWFQLSLEIDRAADGSRRYKDTLMESVPAVLVQTIYRLMVEAFPPEQRALAASSQEILGKLEQIVQHEVIGLQWRPETWRKLRQRLFCPQVLEAPQLNQRESMEVFRKKEKRERENVFTDDQPPLHFGDEPMSEAQLESVMAQRESPSRSSSSQNHLAMKGWTKEQLREKLSPSALDRLDELKQRVRNEMSIERYEELAVQAEELMANQMDQLYADGGWEPGKTPPELVCHLGDDPFSLREAVHEIPEENKELRRSQSVRSMRDSTVAVRRERERREAEMAERRRRDELLQKCIAAPLPSEYLPQSLDTSLVSPALDRLAPSDAERRLLPPFKHLKQQVKMKTPKALEEMTLPPSAKPERPCVQVQFGREERRFSLPRTPALLRSGSRVMLSMDSANLKEEVVVNRLQQHKDAFLESSFDNLKKDTDILTGQRRQRLDADALQKEERAFIEKMEGLVGSKSAPAIRQLRPVLKKTVSMPKLLGRQSDPKRKLLGQPTAKLEQISKAMAQEARAESLKPVEVEKVTWSQLSAVNLLG